MQHLKENLILGLTYILLIVLAGFKILPFWVLLIIFPFHLLINFLITKKVFEKGTKKVDKLKYNLKKEKQKTIGQKEQFNTLSESIGSGIVAIDNLAKIIFYNSEFIKVLKIENSIKDITDLNNKVIKDFMYSAFLNQNKSEVELTLYAKHYTLNSYPRFDEHEKYLGTIFLLHNITEVKELAKRHRQFTADASHELKTPISVIKMASDILVRKQEPPKELRDEFTQMIVEQTNKMERLVNDLLEISRFDRNEYNVELKTVSIVRLVEQTIEGNHLINENNVEIVKDLQVSELEADYRTFSMCIKNLIENAIKFTLNGKVTITTKKQKSNVIITVSDEGMGIPADEHENIFKRFYRVDNHRNSELGGTGLGLSIVKKAVELHKGSIDVKSEVGKGTTFIITIPLED